MMKRKFMSNNKIYVNIYILEKKIFFFKQYYFLGDELLHTIYLDLQQQVNTVEIVVIKRQIMKRAEPINFKKNSDELKVGYCNQLDQL